MGILRSGWRSGPAFNEGGSVLVSVTDFRAERARDLPGIALAGYRLRRVWPQLDGAVGLWLWTSALELRTGSVSVWTDERALRAFVKLPAHVEIMRHYRQRGTLRAKTWQAEQADLREVWRKAAIVLSRSDAQLA
jgi:hypothetical protein